jgi:LmbE family N-acetylglucosaminyl deacetylase
MRWIYLSPHFDDAVLSCGGLIYEQSHHPVETLHLYLRYWRRHGNVLPGKASPEIWTILAGDPPPGPLSEFARQNHALWGTTSAEETLALRREEDEAAAAIVGADLVHFDIPDCIYRRSPKGEYLYTETVMTSPHPSDRRMSRGIATALRSELRQDDLLVCPLGLGGHVDHVLVRQAAESLQRPLLYYADVPYVLNNPETLGPAIRVLESHVYPVSEAGLETWLEGVAAYRSQLDSLFKGVGSLFEAIRAYWSGEAGLRLWHVH